MKMRIFPGPLRVRPFHGPDIEDFLAVRGRYTTDYPECRRRTKRALETHGIPGEDVLLVCANLPKRFVVLTDIELCWLEQERFFRIRLNDVHRVAPPRYWPELGNEPVESTRSVTYPIREEWIDHELVVEMNEGERFRFPIEPGLALGAFWNLIRMLGP